MTLLLVVLLSTSAQIPEGVSARLIDAPVGISTADQVRAELYRVKGQRPFTGLKVAGVTAFSLAAVVPSYILVGALVGGGIGLWFNPASVGSGLGVFFSSIGAAIPPIAWIAMIAVGVVGIALTIAGLVADGPRQIEYRRLRQLDRTLRRAQRLDVGATVVTF